MKFEKATRQKLRFGTNKGLLTTEDLWDLSLPQLNKLAKVLKKELRENEEEDFLNDPKPENTKDQLKFDVVLHILNVKKAEKDAAEKAVETKAKKQRLTTLLADKQDEALKGLSEEQLKEEIAKLG